MESHHDQTINYQNKPVNPTNTCTSYCTIVMIGGGCATIWLLLCTREDGHRPCTNSDFFRAIIIRVSFPT